MLMTILLFLKQPKTCKRIFGNFFHHFSHVFEFKTNKSKCEVASTGILKGIDMVVWGMKCINLKTDMVKIYGIYFSFNKKRWEW